MPAHITHPTPYPEVNAMLHEVLSGVQTILGNHFTGMYLYGSLASGDFDPQRSDIDFVVVTAGELPAEMLPALEAMHARLAASGSKWAKRLEGSYIPQRALWRYDPAQAQHPSIGVDWSFGVGHQGSDGVIQRYILREQGVMLAGPAPQTLIDPVQPNDLRRAVVATLHEWWSQQLDNPVWMNSREYQAYAVLTMCRALYTLQHGTIVSKPVAARWTQEALSERWAGLIERALTWRYADGLEDLPETLEFIRYTLEYSQQFKVTAQET